MYIVKVAPFTKNLCEPFSYFSNDKIDCGTMVTIPLRNKKSKGLVVECVQGESVKQEIKNSKYTLKKIISSEPSQLLDKYFIEASDEISKYYVTSVGSIIQTLVPKTILESGSLASSLKKQSDKNIDQENGLREDNTNKKSRLNKDGARFVRKNSLNGKNNKLAEKYLIQTSDPERYSEYKSLIRNQFALNKSVIFCVPTIEDVLHAEKKLSKGIEQKTFTFNSKMSKKSLLDNWTGAIDSEKPVLIICTGNFFGIPRKDIGYIILERENSKAYKTISRPHFDIRKFAETYAEKKGIPILMGDLILRSETLWRYDQGIFMEHGQIKFRFLSPAKSILIDMKNELKIVTKNKYEYPLLSERLRDLIKNSQSLNEKSFLLCSRKGLYPNIVCGDCGETVKCEHCESPVVLYGKLTKSEDTNTNHFKCHHCGEIRGAKEVCKNCGSWKLNMLGIGIDSVVEKVQKIIPAENIFVLDKDKCKTTKQAHDVINKFLNSNSGVLIGTEIALLYLHEEVENVAVVSLDSMFSIPDFQINERILNILLRSKSKALNNFYIQTRDPENLIFDSVTKGNLFDFYRREFIDRKKFNYPPFNILIKIKGSATEIKKIKDSFDVLKVYLKPYELKIYKPLINKLKNKYFLNGLIKIPYNEWVDNELAQKLAGIPRDFAIEIDADNIF